MIPIQDARGVFTRELVASWNELLDLTPKNFLTSFFTKKVSDTKEVSIEVRRGTEKVASDVLRGTNGNRNSVYRHTEKLFVPPFYNEYFDATELDKYDLLFGQNALAANVNTVTSVIESAVEKLMILRYKIERAYELQAARVFESGIVQLISGDNIDFKRKATSMIDAGASGGTGYWNDPNVDPEVGFQAAAYFLRTIGKASDGVFSVIGGERALAAFKANKNVKQQNYNINIKLIDLHMPQANAEGGVLHGQYAAGSYLFNIWSYPEYYEDATGTVVPYIDPDHVYFIPANSAKFVMSFAGVPAIIRDSRSDEFPQLISQTAADYVINNYIDPFQKKHVFEILSAGLAIPVSIDRIYSLKATNGAVIGG
jgi:hypothetical protein